MKILFVTAHYPPFESGGWDQLAADMKHELQSRGHQTHILTSRPPSWGGQSEPGVERSLSLEAHPHRYAPSSVWGYHRRLRENLGRCQATIERFRPDVVFVHSMYNLTRGIPWLSERLVPGGVVYYMADHWVSSPNPHESYWKDPPRSRFRRLAKRLLAGAALPWIRFCNREFNLEWSRVLCVSHAIREELRQIPGVRPEGLHVVHNGVDTNCFTPAKSRQRRSKGLDILFAGSLVPHKGVDTAIQAMAKLRRGGLLEGCTLTIVGQGHPDYERTVHGLVDREDLANAVLFRRPVPREEMPRLMREFDALVMPSRWEEPLARIMQEAMASGLAVMATLTGGTGDLLVDGQNGLAFGVDDADALAIHIDRLRCDPVLRDKLAFSAREAIVKRFQIGRVIDECERHLLAQVCSKPPQDRGRKNYGLFPSALANDSSHLA